MKKNYTLLCALMWCALNFAQSVNPGDIIINEIMKNPAAVDDTEGEWFEVYNTTGSPIDMNGWVIKDDASISEKHTISSTVIVPANGYVVFGENGDSTTNGGVTVDYDYPTVIGLANSTDGLILEVDGVIIDQVNWDNSFPKTAGKSMSLKISFQTANGNDTGANWEEVSFAYGAGDKGTPGGPNNVTLGVEKMEYPTFSMFPNPASRGEITIGTSSHHSKIVRIYDVLGKQVSFIKTTKENIPVDVSKFKEGFYIVKVEENTSLSLRKLLVK